MANRGRPQIEIDWDQFDKLCQIQCTLVEIAEWFGCSVDTIERRVQKTHGVNFAEYYKRKASKGKISLRRKQFEVALTGNVTMLIWLGKQALEQKDKPDGTSPVDNTGSKPLTTEQIIEIIKVAKEK